MIVWRRNMQLHREEIERREFYAANLQAGRLAKARLQITKLL